MRFTSNANAIYSPRVGRTIEFVGGVYETDDPAEVEVLRRHPLVEVDECEVCGSDNPSACAEPNCPEAEYEAEEEGDGEAEPTEEED